MFEVVAEDAKSSARTGVLKTAHGELHTPLFMPVATKGAVKHVTAEELAEIGVEALICNGYLFSLKPGTDTVRSAGGLHKFIGWRRGIFTDSGGFQLLSKEFLLEISDKGVWLRNPFDLSRRFLMPEEAIKIQNALGSDVAVALDDVPRHGSGKGRIAEATRRTLDWAERCKAAHANEKQMLFGIAQGGTDTKLRECSTKRLCEIGFDGYAAGGLCIGESRKEMLRMVKISSALMPKNAPRYLMGVGSAEDLVECIALGMDVFDSCFPARIARHGTAFTSNGNIRIERGVFERDFKSLDENCDCSVCKSHSRAFLHHLFKTREENSMKYLTYHNLHFTLGVVRRAREAIVEGNFSKFRKEFSKKGASGKSFQKEALDA